jgi:hypothetical protein
MDHVLMIEMLIELLEVGLLMRLIKKWLKAGILDTDGKVIDLPPKSL